MKSCVDSILSLAAANLAAAARSGVNYSRQRLVVHHVTLHREGTAVVLEDKLVSYGHAIGFFESSKYCLGVSKISIIKSRDRSIRISIFSFSADLFGQTNLKPNKLLVAAKISLPRTFVCQPFRRLIRNL